MGVIRNQWKYCFNFLLENHEASIVCPIIQLELRLLKPRFFIHAVLSIPEINIIHVIQKAQFIGRSITYLT